MATYDLTAKATAGVGADSIAAHPADGPRAKMYLLEKVIDIGKMTANGYVMASGDVFQALEVPADSLVLFAGAEVLTAFDGTSPVVNIDFAEGDDIVDGADVSSAGWCASGTNGYAMSTSGTSTWAAEQFVTTTDTIDVVLTAGDDDVTEGVLRVVACVISAEEKGLVLPTEVDRDQLA